MMRTSELYYITDRHQLVSESISDRVQQAIRAGVEWVQIREKDLATRALLNLVQGAVSAAKGSATGARVVLNDRVDVALAASAAGVHLGTRSLPVEVVRKIAPPDFVIGVSCHSLAEALAAEAGGADYVVIGPIYATPSKLQYGPPLGLTKLREVTGRIKIPVFALGGISLDRVKACIQQGAAGIAGIRIFQDCPSVEDRVRELRARLLP